MQIIQILPHASGEGIYFETAVVGFNLNEHGFAKTLKESLLDLLARVQDNLNTARISGEKSEIYFWEESLYSIKTLIEDGGFRR